MTDPISNERLAEMLAGLEGVTPGPWYQTGAPWFHSGDGVLAGSPDGNIAFLIADTDDFAVGRDEYEGFPLGDKERDAAHIARCDPDTIRSLIEEAQASRRQSPEGVEVKGLEWHGDNGHGAGFKYVIAEPSRTPGWRVWVNLTDIGANGMATSIGGCIVTMKAESRDAAKAAAQADYERRVLSSLSVKEPEGVAYHKPASGDTQDGLPLTDEAQDPEGVAPVAAIWRLPPPDTVLSEMLAIATGEDDDDDWLSEQRAKVDLWQAAIRKSLDASPPKAVTITDEMVERAAEAVAKSWGETWRCDCSEKRGLDCDCGSAMTDEREQYDERLSREDCRMASRAALTAALSSEAHNG